VVKEQSFWRNRGKKKANFAVLRETRMAAILTENGFIDTKSDADKLKKSSYLDKIAKGHAEGIAKALRLKKKSTSSTNKKTTTSTKKTNSKKTFYRVVAGSYTERKNADAQVKKLKKAGIDAFI